MDLDAWDRDFELLKSDDDASSSWDDDDDDFASNMMHDEDYAEILDVTGCTESAMRREKYKEAFCTVSECCQVFDWQVS